MASVVEGVQLLQVAGHTYRQRTEPITGSSTQHSKRHVHVEELQDWQVDEETELLNEEAAAAEVDEINSLIIQEGDSFVTQLFVDPEVSCDAFLGTGLFVAV